MRRHDGGVMGWTRRLAALAVLAAAWLLPGPAPAQPLAGGPVLRIETEAHTAIALGLAVSADGTRIATAAYDRSVRIWRLPRLELERVIYLPVGDALQGAANSAAFSPDGRSLAVSGWTGAWDGRDGPWCIYVIDVASGDLRRSVCDLPRRAHHLAFAPDGGALLVALKDAGGLRVYGTADYALLAEDRDYGDVATWVDVDRDGRVVTCALDGKIRLYDAAYRRIAVADAMPEGRKPITVAFSPDATKLGVAYAEPEGADPQWPPAVDVWDAAGLTVAYRPDTRGMDNGTLWRLAWSADGRMLYAGGTWQKAGRYTVRRWADAGRGRPADIPVAANRIVRLRTVPTGGVALVTEVPYLAVIGANDRVVAEKRADAADFTDLGDKLAVNADGTHVQLALEPFGNRVINFSLAQRQIEEGEAPADARLAPAITDSATLDVRDTAWSYRPTLNGKPLDIKPHDQSLTMAIAPDQNSLLLGTSWEIIRYDALGRLLWRTPVFQNTRGLVVSGDGRLVIAAIGDGTLRWYAMDSGRELLALFPHRDGQRWVAWTPSGYYMASVGGDALIGWQVNRGRDRSADFFSVGRFSDQFYRPDIVQRVLAAGDEARAVREANAETDTRGTRSRSVADLLPPVIELIDPPTDGIRSAELRLTVRVRAPSGEPIEEILVRNEGHQLASFDPPILDNHHEGEARIELIVPPRDTELLLFARNRLATSEPARLKLSWAGGRGGAQVEKRTLYVLAIGVSAYREERLRLGFAAKDAGDFVAALARQTGRAYQRVVPRMLRDAEATRDGIREGLAWLRASVGRDDVGMVFLAGHGVDDRDGVYHFLGYEAVPERLAETALPYADLLAGLKGLAGHAVLFVDTCHAGDVLGRPGRASMDVIGLVSRLSQPANGVIVYASSAGDQYALEAPAWRNGAFTKAVVEGLDGAAEYRKRDYITTSMLETYVKERVKDLTARRQTPTVNMPLAVPDLLLARIGG